MMTFKIHLLDGRDAMLAQAFLSQQKFSPSALKSQDLPKSKVGTWVGFEVFGCYFDGTLENFMKKAQFAYFTVIYQNNGYHEETCSNILASNFIKKQYKFSPSEEVAIPLNGEPKKIKVKKK